MRVSAYVLAVLAALFSKLQKDDHELREDDHELREDERERGDVPGWVMITVMTAALVLAILVPFRTAIVDAVTNALSSVTSAGG
jgi:hypothetical protein